MNEMNQQGKMNRRYQVMLIAGIVTVAFNLRPAITSVGPLIGTIRDDLGLSNWSAGMLTSLPLIVFAIMSPIIPKLANRYTNELVLLAGLFVLLTGIATRSLSVVFLLFAGTILIGIGIAICNVLLPGVIKDKFPGKVGLMTSIYTTTMGIFAATASGVSVPLAEGIGLGWQNALLFWGIPTLLGLFVWIYLSRNRKPEKDMPVAHIQSGNSNIWLAPLAWQVACFMGLQSFLFYVTISWLPEILHDYGLSMTMAGWMLFFTQLIGLPASFLVPMIADKFASQRFIVVIMGTAAVSGYTGLLIGQSYFIMIISIILIGVALSGNFALALSFLGIRARTAREAAELSGMAQSIGYLLAAIGPMFIGYLFDLTHAWTVPLFTLLIITVLVILFGLGAGRDKYVFDKVITLKKQ